MVSIVIPNSRRTADESNAGTVFFTDLGTIQNPFLISLITTLVNVCSTPLAFWTIERFGRRTLILYGAFGMVICQFIIAIVGTVDAGSQAATSTMIAFICKSTIQ
jgi:SP family sugar:H+ symporter-like MFS transporter